MAEDILLADRRALAAEEAATMRVVGIKRRLVEQQVNYAARMKVACLEGLEFAGRMCSSSMWKVSRKTRSKS
jgi:hypothetical protein